MAEQLDLLIMGAKKASKASRSTRRAPRRDASAGPSSHQLLAFSGSKRSRSLQDVGTVVNQPPKNGPRVHECFVVLERMSDTPKKVAQNVSQKETPKKDRECMALRIRHKQPGSQEKELPSTSYAKTVHEATTVGLSKTASGAKDINQHKAPIDPDRLKTDSQGVYPMSGPFHLETVVNGLYGAAQRSREEFDACTKNFLKCAGVSLTDNKSEAMPLPWLNVKGNFQEDYVISKNHNNNFCLFADLEEDNEQATAL